MSDQPDNLPSMEEINAAMIEQMRVHEEIVLRLLDELSKLDDVDRRWLAVGRTSIEQGFMAVNRSIVSPPRLVLQLTGA